MSGESVLIVDDTPEIVRLMQHHLSSYGFDIQSADTGRETLSIIEDGFVGPVLLDLNLPDYHGLGLFHEIRRRNDTLPVIIVTAHGTIDIAIEAIRDGAFDFLTKDDAFLERVYVATKNAFAQLELSTKLRRLSSELSSRYKFDQIVSVSEPMKRIFDLLTHAIDSKVTVLIQGESGTGKELVARALHYSSARKSGPFVPVNCAGIPETLLESELFGYEKGAFTGAVSRKLGKFEVATHGTLFLDEIGEMPRPLQSKLLRVLQEREIERIGGNERVKIDVRVVCATNRNLVDEVKSGAFREDLYYRLAVFPVQLPALRERPGDIAVLAHHFLEKYAKDEGKTLQGFEPEAISLLLEYGYPGNVRELENIISHAVVVASGSRIRADDLPHVFVTRRGAQPVKVDSSARLDTLLATQITSMDQIPPLEEVETRVIERAVELCDGNLVVAARRLGVSRATLYRRIGKHGLRRA